MTAPVIRNYGDRALLLECGSIDDVLALAAELRAAELPGVADIVPGARTVLVSLTDSEWLTQVRARLSSIAVGKPAGPPSGQTDAVIDVAYGGSDLDEVCALLDMEPRAVIEAHTATAWRVGFVGFAPGFAYLLGGDPRLHVPRRAEPRLRVPAGSVALAGGYSGVYPRESPGGWQLIGRTDAVLWDADRPRPALLTPGMWVRFRAVELP
ncbi:MAG: allophanate hydrolase subunit 1 [Mycobacterium sp.]|nr:allophanate hydrolase subunit 1 [Mycobacterium sp.]